MFNSRAGHMGNLTKIRKSLKDLMNTDEAREDVTLDQAQFSFRFVITFRRARQNENCT